MLEKSMELPFLLCARPIDVRTASRPTPHSHGADDSIYTIYREHNRIGEIADALSSTSASSLNLPPAGDRRAFFA